VITLKYYIKSDTFKMTEDTQLANKNEENTELANHNPNSVDLNENNANNIELNEKSKNNIELNEINSSKIELKETNSSIAELNENNSNNIELNENNSNNTELKENNSNNVELDESGVDEGPNLSVKDIRKMFRGGPDYQDFAKPKNIRPNRIPSLSTVVRYESTRTMSSESKDPIPQEEHENLKSPTAQQIAAIFEAGIQEGKQKEKLIRRLSRKNSHESGGSGRRNSSCEVFGEKFVDLGSSDVTIPESRFSKVPVENEQAVVKNSISSSSKSSLIEDDISTPQVRRSVVLEEDISTPVRRTDIGKLREELKSQSSLKNGTLDDALTDFDSVFAEFE